MCAENHVQIQSYSETTTKSQVSFNHFSKQQKLFDWKKEIELINHSVLERIWVKGFYLSKWLPQGERGPPKESKSRWIEILHVGSH